MLADQAVQISISTDRITAEILRAVIREYTYRAHTKNQQSSAVHGEQSLEDLNAQGRQLESVELNDKDVQNIRQELKRYGVDFSVMKEPNSDTHRLFFKSQDVDRVYLGLKKWVKEFDRTAGRTPMSEQIQNAAKEARERNAAHDTAREAAQTVKRAVQQEAAL